MTKYIQKGACVLVVLLCALLAACNKTEQFYDELVGTPELALDDAAMYRTAYRIGDTIFIYGRLKGQLQVQIGDAPPVPVQSQTATITSAGGASFTYDMVKVPIVKEMGIGSNRPVSVTGNGVTVRGPAIEIYETSSGGGLTDSLQIAHYAELPADAVFFHCRDGRGSIYLYTGGEIRLIRNAQAQTVLSAYNDQNGRFTIIKMFGGGVDRANHFLYFSALTEDGQPDNTTHLVFRLCRLNLESGQLTTINRTLIPRQGRQMTEAVYLPWEGNISAVKLLAATNIYPAEDGGVYMKLEMPISLTEQGTVDLAIYVYDFYAIIYMDPSGNVRYLYRRPGQSAPWVVTFDEEYGEEYAMQLTTFPGQEFRNIPMIGVLTVDPDEKLLYLVPIVFNGAQGVNLYDLRTRVLLYEYRKERLMGVPQLVGPFNALQNGFYFYFSYNAAEGFGFMPLPGERLLILFFQSRAYEQDITKMPAWSTLDFARGRGDLYAPSFCRLGDYSMRENDLLLNYDETGHLYMTANDRQEIVKTSPR